MRVVVAGAGYVGLASAIGLARRGHVVDLVDIDTRRASAIASGQLLFHEPSLATALESVLAQGLAVHGAYPSRFADADFAFVCVDTDGVGGALKTGSVEAAAHTLARSGPPETVIAIRSTVNPGTTVELTRRLRLHGFQQGVLVNPEFLREGSALSDFEAPTRVVIGGDDPNARERLAALYAFTGAPTLQTDPTSAELIKLASNSALAVRVSLANEIADLAIACGADIEAVLRGVGADPRVGHDYLRPGIGFGGYCLPKDLDALRSHAVPTPLLDAAAVGNARAIERIVRAVRVVLAIGSSVGVVGAGFKPGTDSIRGSRPVTLIARLLEEGYRVTLCDPIAEHNVRADLGDSISYVSSIQEVAAGVDGVIFAHPAPRHEMDYVLEATRYAWDDLGRLLQSQGNVVATPGET